MWAYQVRYSYRQFGTQMPLLFWAVSWHRHVTIDLFRGQRDFGSVILRKSRDFKKSRDFCSTSTWYLVLDSKNPVMLTLHEFLVGRMTGRRIFCSQMHRNGQERFPSCISYAWNLFSTKCFVYPLHADVIFRRTGGIYYRIIWEMQPK